MNIEEYPEYWRLNKKLLAELTTCSTDNSKQLKSLNIIKSFSLGSGKADLMDLL